MREKIRDEIIKNLVKDIGDRRGLGDEFDHIEDDVMKDELLPAWCKIVDEALALMPRLTVEDIASLPAWHKMTNKEIAEALNRILDSKMEP